MSCVSSHVNTETFSRFSSFFPGGSWVSFHTEQCNLHHNHPDKSHTSPIENTVKKINKKLNLKISLDSFPHITFFFFSSVAISPPYLISAAVVTT
jgi:hypothetical protein